MPPPRTSDRWHYFAYGSNMSLKQMAERCPSSLFMGKGRIDGYRFQINDRGVANIVESGRDFVEGLIYQIDGEDKRQLDRSEGVSRGFYRDDHLFTQFSPLPNRGIKTFHVAKDLEEDENDKPGFEPREQNQSSSIPTSRGFSFRDSEQRLPQPPPPRYPRPENPEMIEALVYVSHEHQEDGPIRSEYIARMEKAIADGRKMGLMHSYLNHIDRIVHQDEQPPATGRNTITSRTTTTAGSAFNRPDTTNSNSNTNNSTEQRLDPYERLTTSRPSYPDYAHIITRQPRCPDPNDLGDTSYDYRVVRYIEERSSRQSPRESTNRDRRGDRSPGAARLRQRRGRGREEGNDPGASRWYTLRRYPAGGGYPIQVVERRRRSSSTPY